MNFFIINSFRFYFSLSLAAYFLFFILLTFRYFYYKGKVRKFVLIVLSCYVISTIDVLFTGFAMSTNLMKILNRQSLMDNGILPLLIIGLIFSLLLGIECLGLFVKNCRNKDGSIPYYEIKCTKTLLLINFTIHGMIYYCYQDFLFSIFRILYERIW